MKRLQKWLDKRQSRSAGSPDPVGSQIESADVVSTHGLNATASPVGQASVDPSDNEVIASSATPDIERFGLTVLYTPLEDTRSINVDIVAIHGLGGHPQRTWTKESDGAAAMWLRDFLPETVPDARIMSFGYDSRWLLNDGKATIADSARRLLILLNQKRVEPEAQRRPILFIVHSLGGIVVKKALLLSSQQEEYRPILEATSGIAFLGVPHNGAGLAKYATFAASLSNPVGILGLPKPLRDDLLRGLRHSNDDLIELSEAFKGIGAKLNIKSFYERETMGGTCVVEKASARMGLANEDLIPIHANHRDICRFSQRQNSEYQIICGKIEDMVKAIPSPIRDYKKRITRASKHFVGRDDELEELHEFLSRPIDHSSTARIVDIHGLAGQGKTQLALRYIELHKDKYEPIFWIDGSSEQSLQRSYAEFASLLGFPAVGAASDARDNVKQWLNNTTMPWLLIYDNLDDPVCWKAVHANHPEGPGSHIVLTTRLNTIGDRMHIPLKPLSEEAAVKFLLDKSHSTNEEAARAIARRVGCLALALSIAAAYIATEKCPIDEYLDLFSQHRAERLGSIPARIARTSTDLARGESSIVIKEDDPVFIAFEMSYKSICGPLPTGQVTNSIRLMQLFSFLDGNAISSSLLKRACATKSRYDSNGNLQTVGPKDDGVPPWLVESLTNSASGEWQKSKLVALTRKLATYSLLEAEDVDGEIAYGIHPLVQEFFREGYLDDQQRHRLQREALIIVDHSIPEEEGPWLPHQSYSYIFPQIQHHKRVILALLQRTEPEPKLLHVGLRFSCVYLSQSRYGEAEKLLRVVYDGMKRVFGASHPDTLMAANGLAAVVSYRYEFAESNEWHEMVIEQAPANSMALYEAKRSLAQVYLRRGRLDAAMQLNEEVFKNLKDLLGPDHPYTLLAAMSLAGIYTQIPGRQRQGLELSEESHARYKRCLGSSSLTTIAAAIAVASAHLSLSNAEAAESTLLRVLKSCSETGNRFSYYGVLALSQLARCRLQQGRLQECLGDSLICRDLFVKLLGPESWEAQTTDLLTAQAFICLDCWEDAEKILPPLVDRVTRSLGPESMLAIHAAETTGALYYRMNNLDL